MAQHQPDTEHATVPAPRADARRPAVRPPALVEERVRDLLAEHVPITLILDLAMPAGPHSRELFDDEGLPEVAWWEPRPSA